MLDNLQLLFFYAPVMNVQMLLDGIFIGAVFALAAYGLALVWGVMNVKNLAQGDFVIMGGYLAFSLYNVGVGPIVALPIVASVMFVFGWISFYYSGVFSYSLVLYGFVLLPFLELLIPRKTKFFLLSLDQEKNSFLYDFILYLTVPFQFPLKFSLTFL